MKTNFSTTKSIRFMLLSLFLIPITSHALDLPSLQINHSGKIVLSGAEVTAVSGDTITSVIRLKNATTTATIKTNASTTVQVKGGKESNTSLYSTASVKVGDIINISGIFTGFGSSLNLTAEKIHNLTSLFMSLRLKSGKVESVNAVNGSFVVKTKDNKLVTVTTTATTTFYLANKATSTFPSAIAVNGNVNVEGVLNSSGTVLAASTVRVSPSEKYKENKKDDDKGQKGFKRFFSFWKSNNH